MPVLVIEFVVGRVLIGQLTASIQNSTSQEHPSRCGCPQRPCEKHFFWRM